MKSRTLAAWLLMLLSSPLFAQDARLAYLADRLAIEDLMVGYATAHNTADDNLYRQLFTEDAVFMNAAGKITTRGMDEIVKMVTQDRVRFNSDGTGGTVQYGVMRHVITNMVVSIKGDKATGSCYLLTTAYNATAKKPEILAMGRYEDEYVKHNGEWRISKRTIISDWGNDELAKVIKVGPYTPAEYR